MKRLVSLGAVLGLALMLTVGGVAAVSSDSGGNQEYQVTITNLTRGESFTPVLVASHQEGVGLFHLGDAASGQLTAVAEEGDTGPFEDLLSSMSEVKDISTSVGLVGPGESVTVGIEAGGSFDHFSLVSMLIPTNDGFFAINNTEFPKGKETLVLYSPVYDAGSETNDEICANIPGPVCGGAGLSPMDDGEGYVHIHSGIHGIGDLTPNDYDWNNPAAKITIAKVID